MYIYVYRRNKPSSKPERRQKWKEQVCERVRDRECGVGITLTSEREGGAGSRKDDSKALAWHSGSQTN
jgi:hypothetical protein